MPRVSTATSLRVVAIAFTLLSSASGSIVYGERGGPGQSTSAVTAAQAAPFLGDWTISTSSPLGQTSYLVTLTSTGGAVRATVKTANQPDVVVTNIRAALKSLVLTYTTDFSGTLIPTVLILTPDGNNIRADFSLLDGQFEMSGTGTKGNTLSAPAQRPAGAAQAGERRKAGTATGRQSERPSSDDGRPPRECAGHAEAAAKSPGLGPGRRIRARLNPARGADDRSARTEDRSVDDGDHLRRG